MDRYYNIYLSIVLFCLFFSTQAQYLKVNHNTHTPQELIEDVFINNGCITNINITHTAGGNFSDGDKSFGYFERNGSNFPFEDGIVLSTGKLKNVEGPNDSLSDDDAPNWGSDPDLENALNEYNTTNATVIEFEFTPQLTSAIQFRYIFASEEYQANDESTCIYSDLFAFLIRPTTSTQYQNIALVPGTNTPVKVTTVHPDIPGHCSAINETYFGQFNPQGFSNAAINFNGQTAVLTATAQVVANTTYKIKLAIADEHNARYDSAVFLEGNSFNVNSADLGPDLTGENALCQGTTHTLSPLNITGTPTNYTWYKIEGNTETELSNGPQESQLAITQPGEYKVEISYNGCTTTDTILVEYATDANLKDEVTLYQCHFPDEENEFNLTNTTSIILNGNTNYNPQGFYPSYQDAENKENEIATPSNVLVTANRSFYLRLENTNGCYAIKEIKTILVDTPQEDPYYQAPKYCLNSGESLRIYAGMLGNSTNYTYLWDSGEKTPYLDITSPGTYEVTVTSSSNVDGKTYYCSIRKVIEVGSSEIASLDYTISGKVSNQQVEVFATGVGDYEYALDQKYNYQDSPIFRNLSAGKHTVYVRDKNGCGIASVSFHIVTFNNFFTPNADGINDVWRIGGIELGKSPVEKIIIFDRFGKILTAFDTYGSWDGTYRGRPMPANDYWYAIYYKDGSVKKGNITLLR